MCFTCSKLFDCCLREQKSGSLDFLVDKHKYAREEIFDIHFE